MEIFGKITNILSTSGFSDFTFGNFIMLVISGILLFLAIAKKYEPLDFCEVQNNGLVDLTLIINGNMTLPVPAGTIRKVVNSALWQVGIRNDHAADSTVLNKVIVTLRREPWTIDQWARRNA